MTLRRFPAMSVLLLLAAPAWAFGQTGADPPVFGEQIYVFGELPFIESVAPGEPVTIRFGIGELDIETIHSNELRADLEVQCKRELSEPLCEKYRSRLRLEPRRGKEGLEVRLVGLSKWKLRKLRLDGQVWVPRWSPLTVKVGIGDVDIRSDAEDLVVAMGIGDLTVRVPRESVGAVKMGVRIGDASVSRLGGDRIDGRRRMLLGARINWVDGEGDSSITVGLKIGDAKVVLE